jgi:hypothetical protein
MVLSVAHTGTAFGQLTFGITTVGTTNYPQIDVGNTGTGTSDVEGSFLVVDPFITTIPLTAIQIRTWGTISSGTNNVKVSIYNDATGWPGTLLFTEISSTTTANTWSTIAIPNTYLPAGRYWLAFNTNGIKPNTDFITERTDVPNAGRLYQPYNYGNLFPVNPLPASWTPAANPDAEDDIYFVGVPVEGNAKAIKATLPFNATINSMSFYSFATGDFTLAIYNDNGGVPNALQWTSPSTAVSTTTAWNTVPISGGTPATLNLNAGTYWLVWQWDNTNFGPAYLPGGSNTGDYIALTYGAFPPTWSGGTLTTENWSIYASYNIITTITPANAAACFGSTSVTLTATVAPNPGGGTVQFYIDGTKVGTPTAVNTGTGIATLVYNPSALSTGTHIIRADFSGYLNYLPGSSNPGNNATLTINALPTPTITGSTIICAGSTGYVYITQAGMTNYIWTVSSGGSIASGGGTTNNTITVNWNTAGAQFVSVNYTNANGCTAVSPVVYPITVNPLPVPSLSGPAPVCSGSTGNVYTTDAGKSNYTWFVSSGGSITAGGSATDNTITITWNTAGNQSVGVNYQNSVGCWASSATSFPVLVLLSPSPTITGPTPICAGTTANVYTTQAGMTNYTWSVSAGGTITAGGSATNNTVTVTWNTAGAQTVSVNYKNANGCSAAAPTVYNVTVIPNNTISLTSAAGTTAQTICINTPITNITYATTGATGATFSGLPTGVNGSWLANVVTITGTPTVSGTFNYTVMLTGGCGVITANGSIIVTPNNTISLTSAAGTNAQTVCINTPITNITYATTGATGATFSGLPTGVNGSWLANVVTISGTPTVSGTFNYTVTLTGGCGVITANGSIIVTPNNTISLTSAAGTNAQTVCINTSITNITYATTGATGATFTGLPTGVNGSWLANVVTITGIPTVSGTFNYTVTLTGGCGFITANGTITVTPNNTITLTSAAGTNAQTVCINTPITNITYATTGATGATFTGLPTGVNGSWLANVVTITGTPTVSGTFNYTVTLTGGCGVITANGSITVTPNNTISLTSAAGTNAQTICINTPITNITYATTGATGATFTGLPSGVNGSWLANVVTITGTPTVSGTFNYTVTLTGGCGVVTANGSIIVTPNNTISLTSAAGTNAQTVCINTPITNITYATTGATGATFSGLPTGINGSWLANVVTITGTPTVSGTFNYTVTLTGGCGNITATGTIIVKPNNTITLTSAAGTISQTICINTPITNITYATTGATGATFTGLPTGVTGGWLANVVTISGTPTVSGTFNYSVTLTGGCGVVTANGSIIVTPNNTISLTSAAGTNAQTVCINTPITNITYATTGATGATFSGLPAGVTGNWLANVITISGSPTVSGTFNYTVTLTGGCGVVTANGSIIVTPNNTISLTSAAGTNAQTVCINTPITNITYATTGTTGATFTGLPSGVNGSWLANVVTISGTPTVSGTFNYTVTLTGGCGNITATGTIIVKPNNTITLTSAAGTISQTICINTPITNITYATTGATGATFSGLPAGVTGNWLANVVTITGIPTVSGTFNYTVTLTGGCGNITATGTITVTQNNTIILTSAAGTDAQTVCINTPIINITYSTTGATGVTFSGLPAGVGGVWAAGVVTISGTPTVTGVFTYTITLTGGCGTITKTGTITVTPRPITSLIYHY